MGSEGQLTDVQVRVNLDGGDLEPHGFQQQAGGGCDDPLADAAHASPRDQNVLHCEQVGRSGLCPVGQETKLQVKGNFSRGMRH